MKFLNTNPNSSSFKPLSYIANDFNFIVTGRLISSLAPMYNCGSAWCIAGIVLNGSPLTYKHKNPDELLTPIVTSSPNFNAEHSKDFSPHQILNVAEPSEEYTYSFNES